jgi:predicted TIM-barrel fold metal-dependent hydrolase
MNGLSYNLTELLRQMKTFGVERGLLLSPPLSTGSPLPNGDVFRLCRESRGVLSPVLTVVPTAAGVEEVLSVAASHKKDVKGFKVLLGYFRVFAYDSVFEKLYDYAVDEGLPVMFHTGDTATREGSLVHSNPLTLDALANARPELKIVACHFGNPWIREVGELLYKHEPFFADLSGLAVGAGRYAKKYGEWLARSVSEAIFYAGGSQKIIFGSDYPITTYSSALELVARLEIGEREKRAILCSNARRVFDF